MSDETDLPTVTEDEAAERDWWTLRQAADWAHLSMKILWRISANEDDFPAPVAILPSRGPNPHKLRERAAMQQWFRQRAKGQATWTKAAEVITRQKVVAADDVLSLTELCDATGLKASTVMSYVRRTGRNTRGAMAQLFRPAYRVGNTPYWSQAQVDGYFDALDQHAQQRQRTAAGLAALPEVSRAEAERRRLWSIRRLADWAGIAPVTMHRLANEEGFPAAIAVVPSNGPNPYKVREQAAVEVWLRAHRPDWKPATESGEGAVR